MNRTTRTWRSSYDERFFLRQSNFLKERVIGKRALVALMFGKGSTVGQRRSSKRNAASVMMLALSPAVLLGQSLPASPAEGQKIYAERCVGCHGADARGTDQAPGLAGIPRMRGRSVQKLRDVIRNGIPGTGMPPFDLPARELDALAGFVHSLNGEAAATDVPGDVAAGERFFFGKGHCASCHMVSGRGRPIGPGLSSVGHTMAHH